MSLQKVTLTGLEWEEVVALWSHQGNGWLLPGKFTRILPQISRFFKAAVAPQVPANVSRNLPHKNDIAIACVPAVGSVAISL
jgi:hypothetical protein